MVGVVIIVVTIVLVAQRRVTNYPDSDRPLFSGQYSDGPPDTDDMIKVVTWNIAFAKEVEQAIELAHLGRFIESLPEKGATRVGERGLKLSGGEKQRVSIARTILKRPPIMVFDEATSSLDSKSEQAILNALREIAQDHTSLVIAHRLSTIVDADKIVVLHQGRIVEQGTHRQLLENEDHYAELWRAQLKQREP